MSNNPKTTKNEKSQRNGIFAAWSSRFKLNQRTASIVKAVVWSIIYLLFVLWVDNLWWLVLTPLIVDVYITKWVPWTWWKKSKNKTLLVVMGWVDAIVFALVAVYFINTYVFQNYQIPTPSLEKSLLVGDFLAVSKAEYGPRVPMTPFSFPLVQHTFPVINTKSYLENPQWEYRRLAGIDTIDRNDIVVFNFPTGDTVFSKEVNNNPDYYIRCFEEGFSALKMQNPGIEPARDACYAKGREIVRSRKSELGEIFWRPVDRRENYVKRCLAVAGDWFEIRDNQVFVNGKAQDKFAGVQYNYFVQTDGRVLGSDLLDKLGISKADRAFYDVQNYGNLISYLGLNPSLPVYHFPMKSETLAKIKGVMGVQNIVMEPAELSSPVFPLGVDYKWNRDNYGPVYIPRKGAVIELNAYNYPIYERIIRTYEHNKLEYINGEFVINGEKTAYYKFKMNYYWMMGDNRHNSADSRFWGFVPEDHVVGRPMFVWLSLDKDKSLFEGKIRFERFFMNARQ